MPARTTLLRMRHVRRGDIETLVLLPAVVLSCAFGIWSAPLTSCLEKCCVMDIDSVGIPGLPTKAT